MVDQIPVIFADKFLLVVDKPAGLLSLPDRFQSNTPHLKGVLEATYGPLWTVHRLDRFTSGLVLLARDEGAHKALNDLFASRDILKKYLAVVHGTMSEISGSIIAPIAEDPMKRGQFKIHPKGKESHTDWKLEKNWSRYSFLELTLHTGRTHQIRVHLNHIGHPVVADPLYSNSNALYLSEIKKRGFQLNRSGEERPLISRQALHASYLEFDHPFEKKSVSFSAPTPKDISALINQLSKWDK